ncbi:MAG: hypothetical protein SFV22_12860 [Saprospiraceae bacterium]|nr:hypothetical protein [Saprospiraceae bacterium]
MDQQALLSEIRQLIARDELPAALEKMRLLLGNDSRLDEAIQQSGRFFNIKREMRLGTVSHENASLTQNQIRWGLLELAMEIENKGATPLPQSLAEDIITDRTRWLQSLQRELMQKQGVSVGNRPSDIIQHFGWLIEEFLRKMQTKEGQQNDLRAFSYMTEAWQNTLRYLCYIQLAQLLKSEEKPRNTILTDFIAMRDAAADNTGGADREARFDYLNLLLVSTDLLKDRPGFVPQIADFVRELTDTESELFEVALFLAQYRRQLLAGAILPDDPNLSQRLDEYRTALVFWLRRIAFLVKYRLVSIKEISLNYRLGTAQQFVHLYGELHGLYDQLSTEGEDYNLISVEGLFTYSQSVLLFKGNEIQQCLQNIGDPDTYLSLSPLLIDQSVFSEKTTQTPEVYYFTGQTPGSRQYEYAQYKNELPLGAGAPNSNKTLRVKSENSSQPKLNDLYEQLETVFKPFKNTQPQ